MDCARIGLDWFLSYIVLSGQSVVIVFFFWDKEVICQINTLLISILCLSLAVVMV